MDDGVDDVFVCEAASQDCLEADELIFGEEEEEIGVVTASSLWRYWESIMDGVDDKGNKK